MRPNHPPLFLLSTFALLAACSNGARDDVGQTSLAVIGGEEAPNLDVFVSIGPCSGALIAPNVILSAAHCVGRPDANGVLKNVSPPTAFRATTKPSPGIPLNQTHLEGFELEISEIHILPEATKEGVGLFGYDIALLVLAHPVTGITPLVPRFELPVAGDLVTVAGYGATCSDCTQQQAVDDGGAGTRRQRSGVAITCSGDCKGEASNDFASDRAVAFYDSGGPVRNGAGEVIGTVSRTETARDVYEAIAPHKDFVMATVVAAAATGNYEAPSWAKPAAGAEAASDAGASSPPAANGSSGGCAMGTMERSTQAEGALALLLAVTALVARRRRLA